MFLELELKISAIYELFWLTYVRAWEVAGLRDYPFRLQLPTTLCISNGDDDHAIRLMSGDYTKATIFRVGRGGGGFKPQTPLTRLPKSRQRSIGLKVELAVNP